MTGKIDKSRTIESLRSNNEFVQHVLLGIGLAHSGIMQTAQKIEIHYTNGALDLTEYAQEFLKDPQNERRLVATMTRVLVDGVTKAYEAAKAYFVQSAIWNGKDGKKWEDMYLVAGQIRNMESHNLVWTYNDDWERKLQKNGKSFPLQYGGLKIEKIWQNQKARIEQLPNIQVISLIRDIQTDVEKH